MKRDNTPSRLLLDNSTVAGAGRALYEKSPDISDRLSLLHLVTAALLCDEIHVDGSSRQIPIRVFDAQAGTSKTTQPLPAIWTWERSYPALAHFCNIIDGFWQRWIGFDKENIVTFALDILKGADSEHFSLLDVGQIPSIYLSEGYFDRKWIQDRRAELETRMDLKLSDSAFKILLYAWRGIYYYELSKLLGITYFAHPQRSRFIEPFLVPGNSLFTYDSAALKLVSTAISDPYYRLLKKHAREKSEEFSAAIFPFAAYILRECRDSRQELVDKVVTLRETKEFRELRCLIAEYDRAYRCLDLLTLRKIQNEVNRSMRNFARRYDAEPASVSMAPRLPVGVPERGMDANPSWLKLPSVLFTELFQKPYLSLMWEVGESLLKGEFGLDKLLRLSPIPKPRGDSMEWIVMEGGNYVRFEGESEERLFSEGQDLYVEQNVAIPGPNNPYSSWWPLLSETGRPCFPTPRILVDLPKPPWEEPLMRDLRRLFLDAYGSITSARHLAQTAGIDLHGWNAQQAPLPAWNDLLEVTMMQGKLRVLIDRALDDMSVHAYHDRFRAFLNLRLPPSRDIER